MATAYFNVTNKSLRAVLRSGITYTCQTFQRDYSWTEEEWDDLWRDIESVMEPKGDDAHYMGYLVLQSRDSKNFDIIDGQQRLTTLSIMVLAVLANLQKQIDSGNESENNRRRQDQLRNSLIGYLDPVTLLSKSKLNLNRNNDSLYQTYLVPLQPAPCRRLKASEHLLRNAFEWFDEKIGLKYHTGEELAGFIDRLTDKLFFTVITVADELNAYKVFETLNPRGVKLSSTDLLKNYLFSVVHSQNQTVPEFELEKLEQRWEELSGKLEADSFPDFLRVHWNSRNRFLRQAELFKRIRDQVRNREQVFTLIRKLQADVDTYVALSKPEDEFWKPAQKPYLRELRMFSVRQVYALLLAAYRNFSEKEFEDLLRVISIISFRYNVISNNPPNEQERIYNKIAVSMEKEGMTYREVISELKELYVPDEEFKASFANKILKTTQSRNKRIVRYIFARLEKHLNGNEPDPDSAAVSLEHIMPENLSEAWLSVDDADHAQFVYRLGNMCLLSATQNRAIGNAGFAQKRSIYEESAYEHTRRIASENTAWDPSRIEQQQQWLARQAAAIWRVAQFE